MYHLISTVAVVVFTVVHLFFYLVSVLDFAFHQRCINPGHLCQLVLLWYMKWPLSTPQCNTAAQAKQITEDLFKSQSCLHHTLTVTFCRCTSTGGLTDSLQHVVKGLDLNEVCLLLNIVFFSVLMRQIDHLKNTNLSLQSSQSGGCFSVTESSELGSERVWI